ncbi:MAG: hypothetical protein M3367_10440 [Acidobacteriota bacterium]|nr:hypothetical protein [Acidobacteriota bacterium]
MRKRSSTKQVRSKDENVLAKSMIDSIIDETESETFTQKEEKNPAAVSLGRLGGLKGGKARAKMLSAEKRSEIARKAANARWKKP